jgi:phage terminase large subunit-like protein
VSSQPLTRSTSSPPSCYGAVVPRLWTPPLRDLEDPEGVVGLRLHRLLRADRLAARPLAGLAGHPPRRAVPGRPPRYRKAIILVARQNGKTLFTRLLILYWMFVERVAEIVATSTDRAAAKRSWKKVVELAERTSGCSPRTCPLRHTALQIGEEDFWNNHGAHYRFAAPTRRAGRGDTLPRALLDELREHRNRDTWDAIVPAQNAVADALLVCISNEGDAESVVLHEEHDAAETFILTGEGDPRTFLASWSAPAGPP